MPCVERGPTTRALRDVYVDVPNPDAANDLHEIWPVEVATSEPLQKVETIPAPDVVQDLQPHDQVEDDVQSKRVIQSQVGGARTDTCGARQLHQPKGLAGPLTLRRDRSYMYHQQESRRVLRMPTRQCP